MKFKTPFEAIQLFHSELIYLRRDLHANPELGFNEIRTSGIVAGALEALGLEVHRNIGRTGVVATIKGRKSDSGRMIGLRADMDALPITENSTAAYCSSEPGLMHACGHDGHVAVLLGAAKYLAQTKNFNGTAVLIFQPAEEGLGGAKAMLADGLFERWPCDEIYAMHNWPALPPGVIGINPGPMMAASDKFEIVIRGRGGHGGHPYLTVDPIIVTAHVITALQTIVSRNVHPVDSAVISFGSVQAGHPNASNVIPDEARLVGTVRSFKSSVQKLLESRMRALIESTCEGFGATASFIYTPGYAATVNSTIHAEFVVNVAKELFGQDKVVADLIPSMGSEDFAFMLQERPGAYFRLGQGGAEEGRFLHNAQFDFNDAVIPVGSAMFASLIERGMPLDFSGDKK